MKHSSRAYRWLIALVVLIGLALTLLPTAPATEADADALHVVQAAWQKAQQSGVYHFTSQVVQTTYPAPSVANTGRSSRSETIYLDGESNTPERQFQLTVRNDGSVLNTADALQVRIDGDRAYGRSGNGEWQEMDSFTNAFAPGNDLLVYLAGAKNVQVQPVDAGNFTPTYTQYSFDLDGAALAKRVRDQLELYLSEKGELPAQLSLQTPNLFRDATGQGSLWISQDGLPLRLTLKILYPREASGAQVEAELKTDFSNYAIVTASAPFAPIDQLARSLGLPRTASDWQHLGSASTALFMALGMVYALTTRSRSKKLQAALVLAIIFSMVVTPLLDSGKVAAFYERQNAQQAQADQQQKDQDAARKAQEQLAGPAWDAHQNPMDNSASTAEQSVGPRSSIGLGMSAPLVPTTPNDSSVTEVQCTDAEKSTDTDQDLLMDCDEKNLGTDPARKDSDRDGLTDGVEVLRLGTDPTSADTDGDAITDYLEVTGFALAGGGTAPWHSVGDQRWYSDPNNPDTDKDNLSDGLECPERALITTPPVANACLDTNGDGVPEQCEQLTHTCRDTNADATPDMFARDSDGDGVADQVDVSPLTVLGASTAFSRTNPFQLKVENLNPITGTTNAYYPVLVDFQLRPKNPKHLTYALNVLDWPGGDESGQVQRHAGNDSTFAKNLTPAQIEADPRSLSGDLRLIPMLEIELSGNNIPLPMTTTVKTQVQLQGVDTSWAATTTPPSFTTWLSGTLNFLQVGTSVNITKQFDGSPTLSRLDIYTGTCADGGTLAYSLSANQTPNTLANTRLVNLADGQHFVLAGSTGHTTVCANLIDLPNGAALDRIVDLAALTPYGVSVRDKNRTGTLLAYVPMNVMPDESGAGQAAFSARMLYQPTSTNLGDNAQNVRLVWIVQMLTDWCKPMPDSADESSADVWCNYGASWNLDGIQIVQSYPDEWQLTGLKVREDHGVKMAVAWEDPADKPSGSNQFDTQLWQLSYGLEAGFVSGRDQNANNVRDIGVVKRVDGVTTADTTISERMQSSVITDRLGIPVTATMRVVTTTYPYQDAVALMMMSGTQQILNQNFNAYTTTAPTLLFAREEHFRSISLDRLANRTVTGTLTTLNFTGESLTSVAAMSWAPYRFKDGAWQSYPLNEYWEAFGAWYKTTLPVESTDPTENDDINGGKVMLAQAYYLAMNQGRAAVVQQGRVVLAENDPAQSDTSVVEVLLSGSQGAFGFNTAIGPVLKILFDVVYSGYTSIRQSTRSSPIQIGGHRGLAAPTRQQVLTGLNPNASTATPAVRAASVQVQQSLKTRFMGMAGKAATAFFGMADVTALVLGIAAVASSFSSASSVVIVSAAINTTAAALQLIVTIKAVADVVRKPVQAGVQAATATATAAAAAAEGAEAAGSAGMACAVIGFIIAATLSFACAFAIMGMNHLKAGSAAANAVFAQAIAYTIVGVIMLVISMIPVVGQIIAAILGLIDALIFAICSISTAAGYSLGDTKVGQWACKGLSGLMAELIKWGIYSSSIMIDLQQENRLEFGRFNYDMANPDLGITVGSGLIYNINLTNTIQLENVLPTTDEMIKGWKNGTALIPADWKSMSYFWQFSTTNLKSSTFNYQWQAASGDIHDDLNRNDMTNDWTLTGHQTRRGVKDQAYITRTATSSALTLTVAGINRNPGLYLSEGMAVPLQECIGVPNLPVWSTGVCPPPWVIPYVCWTPVCYVRTDKSTNNFDFGASFQLDVFPATLDEFYAPVAKDGGLSLAWGQAAGAPKFARQLDFDGDTLLNQADGGNDPNDALWDIDGDSLPDGYEVQHGTNPELADTDGDGLNDADELRLGTDPNRVDTDGDGLTDREEVLGWEYVYALTPSGTQLRTWVVSDPFTADEDFDTISDFKEKAFGFNPQVPSDPQVLDLQTGFNETAAPGLLLRLDETAGVTAFNDAAGRGHTALCDLATCPLSGQNGRYGFAAQFSSDALAIAHSTLTERAFNYTIAAWISPTTVSGLQTILATARTKSSNDGFAFSLNNDRLRLQLYNATDTWQFDAGPTTVQANRWTHVAAVITPRANSTGGSAVTFYINGSAILAQDNVRTPQADLNDALLVGAGTPIGTATLTNTFTGNIDEVTFYPRALTSSDITALRDGQYDPDDSAVQPGATIAYTSTIGNKLMDRYGQGLWSISTSPANLLSPVVPPQTFVLPPQAQTAFSGTVSINSGPASSIISLTQAAQAEITNWREEAGYAQLWLKLDDPITSTTFADTSGQTTPATGVCASATCPARQVPGYFDYGVSFAASQVITLPDVSRLGLYDSSFSVSAWIKPANIGGTGTRTVLIANRSNNDAEALRLEVQNGQPAFVMHNTTLAATDALRDNKWYHLVYRYDKALGEQAIYVNGELKASSTGITPTLGVSTTAVLLGRGYNNTNSLRGSLDDLRIYQRALDLNEIRTLYNQPVLRLGFEDATTGINRTFVDSSGFNQRVECSGNNCPGKVSGVSGQSAASFDGTDYVHVDRQPSLSLGDGQFTLAAWVWPTAQGEPVNAASNMTATFYNNASFTGTPSQTLPVTWTAASMDADNSPNGTWLVNYAPPPGQWPAGFSGRWTGQFEFSTGITYTFYSEFSQMDAFTATLDNSVIASLTSGTRGKAFTVSSTGVHTLTVAARTRDSRPMVRFGWIPPHVQGIIGQADNGNAAYPTLQSVSRRVRFGFGTGSTFVSNTTSSAVLAANTWNHVVLAFGPRYNTDGTFNQNGATLYVNDQVKADWGFGSSWPLSTTTSFDIGRATRSASSYVDRFKMTEQADGLVGNAEIYLNWNGDKICVDGTGGSDSNGSSCIWGGLDTDSVRNVKKTRFLYDAGGELRAWESDDGERGRFNSDDPLCDVGSGACTAGYTFWNTQPSIPFTRIFDWQGDQRDGGVLDNEDQTRISLYLGDSTHWTYRNPSLPLKGRLDDVVLYKRPLTADEVHELYLSASAALRLSLDDAPGSQSFENSVDLSLQSNAFCTGAACPTAGVSGRMNQAALFDGSSDILSTTLLLDESTTSPGATLMGWVKPSSTSTGRHDVFSTDSGGNQWSIVRDGSAWKIANGQSLIDTGFTADVGQWQHIAATFKPGVGITFYKNGTLSTTLTTIATSTTNAPLSIGGKWNVNKFDGTIDDARAFISPLSAASIKTLWEEAPVWQLHLDETVATTTTFGDAAGSNVATCSGAACPTAGVGGQVSLGAEFNVSPISTTDQLSVADNAALDVGSFTIGAWVQPAAILTRSQTLIDKGSNFRLSISANGLTPTLTIAANGGCTTAGQVSGAVQLMPAQWNHVMGAFDGSALQLYVNGYPQGRVTVSGAACVNSSNLLIGNDTSARFFAGRLDEVTLYKRALSPTEVRDMFLYQGKLVEERSSQNFIVDRDDPTSQLQAFPLPYLPGGAQLFISAHDATTHVSLVELGVEGPTPPLTWQSAPACIDSTGDTAWCPYFKPSGEGHYRLQTSAIDAVGHKAVANGRTDVYVDQTPPTLTSSGTLVSTQPHPTHENEWIIHLSGTVSDPVLADGSQGSGVLTDSVRITLVDANGAALGDERQIATVTGNTWAIDYVVPEARPSGTYTAQAEASDRAGNVRAATHQMGQFRVATALVTVQLDAAAPLVDLNPQAINSAMITDTLPLNGIVSEVPAPRNAELLLHFEELSNARTFADHSGWGRQGTCSAATCPTSNVAGQYGRAVQFNGAQFITVAHSALSEVSAGFSIAAWVNPTTLTGVQRFIATARTRSNDGFSFGFNGSSPQFSAFGVKDFNFTAPLTANTWTHVAAVVQSDNSVDLYVDGNLRGTITSTVPITPDLDDVLMLGGTTAISSTTLSDGYNGLLDEVIVVNRALAVDEIRTLAARQPAGVSAVDVAYQSTLPGSPFYNEPIPAGEVLHLALEDRPTVSDTINFVDASGLNHTGFITGTATRPLTQQAGHTNNAVKFNGLQDKISVNSFGTFNSVTFAGWVYQPAASAQEGYLINACFGSLSINNRWPMLEVRFGNGTSWQMRVIAPNPPMPLHEWVFLAATYDSGWLRLYQNGQLVASIYKGNSLAQCSTPTSIGDGLVGSLDEVRMFNRALSVAEIKALYLGTNPIIQLPLDETWLTNDQTTADVSGWDHTSTYHTDNVTGTQPIGQVGAAALALDGVNDYVSVAPNSGLDLSGGRFSIAAWIYPSPQDTGVYPILSSGAYGTAYPFLHVINRTQLSGGFGANTLSTGGVLSENAWNHVAATFDGTTYMLYVNGTPRLITTTLQGQVPAAVQQFDIGRGSGRFWRGQFDEVRVYARALTSGEVQALAQTRWLSATIANPNTGLSAWNSTVPAGLEGTYNLNLRGTDAAGHVDTSAATRPAWSGEIDTLAPRVTITRATVSNGYRYTTVAEDYNLLKDGFASPCGAGVITTTEYYQAPWYKALAGASDSGRVYRLKAECVIGSAGLFEQSKWLTGTLPFTRGVAVSGTQVYVANGALYQLNASNASLPRFITMTNAATGDAYNVVISGTYAYLADGRRGLSTIDLNNPAVIAGNRDTSGLARDVARYGNYAYVADGTGGLRVMDVTNPASPTEVGSYTTSGEALAVALSGAPGVINLAEKETTETLRVNSQSASESRLEADSGTPPANLSAEEWTSIQHQIEQANATSVSDGLMLRATKTLSPSLANAYFGNAAVVDGDTLVVGASSVNRAYVFTRHSEVDNPWGLSATLVPTDVVAGDAFGNAVALDGDWLAVSAPNATYSGIAGNGRVYLYYRNQGGADAWGLMQNIDYAGSTNDQFGYALTMDGDVLIASALNAGRAVVYSRSISDWTQRNIITVTNTADNFGYALALVGDTLAIGAPLADVSNNTDAGATYIYTRSFVFSADEWTPVITLTASDGAMNDHFGSALSVSGDRVLVGAPQAAISGRTQQGAAYLFARNQGGANAWGQVKKIISTDGAVSDTFGNSLALDDDRALIGADSFSSGRGKAYTFERNEGGVDNWGQRRTITLTGGLDVAPAFGRAVALNRDTVLITANNQDTLVANDNRGAAYVYALSGDTWLPQMPITPTGLTTDENFGWRTALSGDTLVVGAPNRTGFTNSAVYIFQRNQNSAEGWGLVKRLAGPASSEFGYAVALDGDTLVVGAPNADTTVWMTVTNSGVAFVYDRNLGGANNWGESGQLPMAGSPHSEYIATGDRWGTTVAVDGDLIVIGSSTLNRVRTYVRRPFGDTIWWAMGGTDTPQANHFGSGLSLSGDLLAVGADDNLVGPGAVYIYNRDYNPGPWVLNSIISTEGSVGLGSEVRLDGGTLAVVACDPIVTTTSQIQLYDRNLGGADNWGLAQTVPATTSLGLQLQQDLLAIALSDQTQIRSRHQDGFNQWGLIQTLPITNAYGLALDGDTLAFGYPDARQKAEVYRLAARPIGMVDAYDTVEHGTLNVAASGVLGNDLSARETLTATVNTTPTHGTLTLNPNGSFIYALGSTNHYTGTDTFTYRASDGTLTSNPITVTITITPANDAPTIDPIADVAVEPNSSQKTITLTGLGPGDPYESQSITVTAQSTNTALIPNPIVKYTNPNVTGTLTFTPTTGQSGKSTIVVTVTDGLTTTVRTFTANIYPLSGPFAYVAMGNQGLSIVNLSTPAQPQGASVIDTPGVANDVVVSGTYAYIADGINGLVIVNVANPASPQIAGTRATNGNAQGVALIGRYAYVADGLAGVTVIDVFTPTAPALIGTTNTPGTATKIATNGRYLYVTDATGGLRIFDTQRSGESAAACDSTGHCTVVAATPVVALVALDQSDESKALGIEAPLASNAGVSILDVPLLLDNTDALTITGRAFAEVSSLRALTISVDGSAIFTQTWATDEVSQTLWTAPWDPTGLPDGEHQVRAEVLTSADEVAEDVIAVTLDTQAPQLALSASTLTGSAYHAPGLLDISGFVTDTAGATSVQVIFEGDAYGALLDGNVWHTSVSVDQVPDGATYTVTVQANDVGGHTTELTQAITVDAAAPSNVDLTLSTGGNVIQPNATIRTLSPTLTLDWTSASDGSGVESYLVDWVTSITGTQSSVRTTQYPTRTATYQPGEGQAVWASVGSRDVYGQESWQTTGPVYADTPRTPDYAPLDYDGWQDSGCSLVGVDRRIERSTLHKAALSAEQKFYVTWSNDDLRLAWTGANWDQDGDLFVYLDTQPGGTTTAYNPYIATSGTTIYLPGVTPTSTVNALAADYLVWVRDAETAQLMQWQGTDWALIETLSPEQYLYQKEVNDGQTELRLPFNSIGLSNPASSPLRLIALASEDTGLRLWSVMPNANPINSDQVAATGMYTGDEQTFALSRDYQWNSVGAGVCPNGSDGTSRSYADVEARVSLTADPIGAGYSFLNDNLFWLWSLLAGDRAADVTSYFDFMSTDHPRVGANQTITYTLEYRNLGTDVAKNVEADVSALYALRLAGGVAQQTIGLGNVAPGQIVTASFSGHIDLAASPLAWAAVAVDVYDAVHPRSGAPVDRLWVDHQVDRSAPEFLGLTAPEGVIRPQPITLSGYAYDESAVPLLAVTASGQSPVNCVNAVSQAGQWSCVLDATGRANGDVLNVSLQATDIYGQMSTATNPQPLIVDALPPTVSIDLAQNQIVNSVNFNLTGSATDNYGLDRVEVCASDSPCANAAVQLADATDIQTYDDAPENGLAIDSAATCGGGEIVRTFNVPDTFAIGAVRVGFNATHADRDEMRVELSGPSGTSVRLLADDGLSGTHLQNYAVLLSDTASQSYATRSSDDATLGFARAARPYQPLRAFNGQTAAGTWTLRICDTNPSANDGLYQRSQLVLEPQAPLRLSPDGQWSYSLSTSNQEDYVAHTISVYGIDRAGNRTTQAAPYTYIVDNVAPVMTVTQLINRTPLTYSVPVLNIAATDGGGVAQMLVFVEAPNTTYTTLAMRDGDGWHFDLEPSLIGTYRLWISAYDNAGNVASSGAYQVNVTGPLPYTTFLPIVAYNYMNRPYVVLLPVITRNYAASQTRR